MPETQIVHKMHLIGQELGLLQTSWNHLSVDQSRNWHIILCTFVNFVCVVLLPQKRVMRKCTECFYLAYLNEFDGYNYCGNIEVLLFSETLYCLKTGLLSFWQMENKWWYFPVDIVELVIQDIFSSRKWFSMMFN